MKHFHDEGIVIKKRKFGEKEELVTFLSPYQGKISCVVYGSRDPKSRKSGLLELFNTLAFDARQGSAKLPVLQQVKPLRLRAYALVEEKQELSDYYRASEILKFTSEYLQDGQIVENAYYDLNSALDLVAAASIVIIYKIRLLNDLGYLPDWKNCSVCHEKLVLSDQMFWANENKGFVHAGCKSVSDQVVSEDLLKVMSYFQEKSIVEACRLDLSEQLIQQIDSILGMLDLHD